MRVIIILLICCVAMCSIAHAVPLIGSPSDPFGDDWFISVGLTNYFTESGDSNPAADVFAATPWWFSESKVPDLRLSTAVSYSTKFEAMFFDFFGGVKIGKRTSLNLGLSAFDLKEFGGYQVKPFVSYLVAVPLNKHIFVGAFIASRPESDWAIDGSMLVRINLKSWSGR